MGARVGLAIGLMLAALATVARLIGGEEVFTGMHTSFVVVVTLDVCAGVAIGVLVSVLEPVARSKVGAAILGAAVAALLGCVLQYLTGDSRTWTRGDIALIGIFSLTLGVPVGLSYREIFVGSKQLP